MTKNTNISWRNYKKINASIGQRGYKTEITNLDKGITNSQHQLPVYIYMKYDTVLIYFD